PRSSPQSGHDDAPPRRASARLGDAPGRRRDLQGSDRQRRFHGRRRSVGAPRGALGSLALDRGEDARPARGWPARPRARRTPAREPWHEHFALEARVRDRARPAPPQGAEARLSSVVFWGTVFGAAPAGPTPGCVGVRIRPALHGGISRRTFPLAIFMNGEVALSAGLRDVRRARALRATWGNSAKPEKK